MQVPATLWTERGFWDRERTHRMIIGIYCGLMIIAILYNLLLFLATRDKNYLFFTLFVLSIFVWSSSNEGLAQAYLWPDWPWWANVAVPFSLLASCFFALVNTVAFLDLRKMHRGWKVALQVGAVLSLLGMPLALVLPYTAITGFAAVWVAPSSVLIWLAALVSWLRGYRPARYYVTAWSLFFVGIVLVSLSRVGLLSGSPLVESAWIVGFVLNIFLVSIALADRINLMQQDKDRARARALQIQKQAAAQLKARVEEKKVDLKRRTTELAEAYERLAQYDRLKSNFFANVSHELRTPLTLILTPLERLLASEDLPEVVGDKLRSMQGNAQRLLRLVNQLLDFSRLEANSVSISYEQLDVRALLEPVVQAFVPFARSKELQLSFSAPEQLPRVYVDPVKLEKVASNLLSNACKFTETGGKVLLDLTCDDRELKMTVQDTGIGISAQDQQRIFDRFQQVDGSSSRGYEGTGIGLALSKELVELMGARLTLKSEPGFGSQFTVSLPLGTGHIQDPSLIRDDASSAEQTVGAASAAQPLMAEAAVNRESTLDSVDSSDDSRPRLLVVEDNADMRSLVAEVCQQEFRVLEAADGQDGLELIRKHRPTLVISDVMMPRMDGQQMLRELRADPEIASIGWRAWREGRMTTSPSRSIRGSCWPGRVFSYVSSSRRRSCASWARACSRRW
jgi:signal transduction histidine kinase